MADLKQQNKFIAQTNILVHLIHSAIPEKAAGHGWKQLIFQAEARKSHGWKRMKQREIKNKQTKRKKIVNKAKKKNGRRAKRRENKNGEDNTSDLETTKQPDN